MFPSPSWQHRCFIRALNHRPAGACLSFIIGLLLLTPTLPAQTTLYWDVNGTTAGAGGTTPAGGWRTNNASYQNWNTVANGTGTTGVWTANAIAVFSAGSDATGSYTVTVNSVSADSIVIQEGNILFNSSTITLTGATPSVSVASGLTATFNSRLSGTSFVKSGAGTVVFLGTAKNYTGATTISAGTLRLGAANMIGNSSAVTVASGATFALNNFAETIGSIAGTGSITLGSATLIQGGDNTSTTFGGVISGTGGLTKSGTGTLTLTGANTFAGTLTVSAGVLNIRNSAALGSTAGGTVVTTGEELQLQGGISVGAEALNITGTGVASTGALRNIADTNSFAGLITLAGNTQFTADAGALTLSGGVTGTNRALTITGAGDLTIGAITTGSGTLTKRDTGTLTLTSANTYTGVTTIGSSGGTSGGTVRLNAGNALANNTLTLYAGTLDLNGNNDTIGALALGGGASGTTAAITSGAGTLTLGGNLTYSSSNNANGATIAGRLALGGANRTFTVNDSSAATDDLTISAVISGSNALTKSGTGTLVLSGANTYTGTTTVSGGILNIRNGSALGSTAGGTVVTTGEELQLQGGISVGAEALSITGTGATGTGALRNVSGNNTYGGAITLTGTTSFASDAGNLTLSGGVTGTNRTLTLTGAGDFTLGALTTGTGALNLNGSGTTTLTGASTSTGNTNVNAGTLRLASSAVLSDSSAVIVAGGALFDVNGQTETIASLAGAGTVALGSGALTTAGNASTTFSGGFAGTGSFTKAGTGVLTLDTSLTFAGTFNLAGGTLRLSDMALTLGTLNITGNSIIDFAGVSSLSLTNFSIGAGVTLTVQNWANASDYFFTQNWAGAAFGTTGSAPMNQVVFSGFTAGDTKWQAYDHQITPVPEPSTYGAGLLACLAGLTWLRARRRAA